MKKGRGFLLAKRLMDIVGAFLGIILFSWVFLITPICIKLEAPKHPVLYKQLRIGKNGKAFYMYKFRSMVPNADQQLKQLIQHNEAIGPLFKIQDDPRITKVGRIIRKTSIDELPQIWNVLRGEMSLVGPRPPLPSEVEKYCPYEMQRLLVTPGCTGLSQVSGRSNLRFDQMVELDLAYIQNQSIIRDIKIMLKTFIQLIHSTGAY